MERTLYTGNRNASSWAFRAWLALKEADVDFKEELVDIRRPQRWQNLNALSELSPSATVPLLVDKEAVIFDSLAIMEYANDLCDGRLLPQNPLLAGMARSYVAWQHSTFSRVCPALSFESAFYPDKRKLTDQEVGAIKRILDLWETSIAKHQGDYLFGDFSLADIALVPSVVRFSSHYSADNRWPLVARWTNELLNRHHVKNWLDEAKECEPIYLPGYYFDS